MRSLIAVVGIVLIIFGIAVLGYKGFTYTTQEKVAEIGNVQVTTAEQKMIYFQPVTGVLSLVAGIILVVVSRKKS